MLSRVPAGARPEIEKAAMVAALQKKAAGDEYVDAQAEAEELGAQLLERLDAAAARGRTTEADHRWMGNLAAQATANLERDGIDVAERVEYIASLTGKEQTEAKADLLSLGGLAPAEIARVLSVPEERNARLNDLGARVVSDPVFGGIAGNMPNDRRTQSTLHRALMESVGQMTADDFEKPGLRPSIRKDLTAALVRSDKGEGLSNYAMGLKNRGEAEALVSEALEATMDRELAEKKVRDAQGPASWSVEKSAAWLDEFGKREAEKESAGAGLDGLPSYEEMKADVAKWNKEDEAKAEAAQKSAFAHFFPVSD